MHEQAQVVLDSTDFQTLKLFQQKYHTETALRLSLQTSLQSLSKELQLAKLKNQVLTHQKTTLLAQLSTLRNLHTTLTANLASQTNQQSHLAAALLLAETKARETESINENHKRAIRNLEQQNLELKEKINQVLKQKSTLSINLQEANVRLQGKEEERNQIAAREKELVMKIMAGEKENACLREELTFARQKGEETVGRLEQENAELKGRLGMILTNKEEYTRQYLGNMEEALRANVEISKGQEFERIMSNQIASFMGFINGYKK